MQCLVHYQVPSMFPALISLSCLLTLTKLEDISGSGGAAALKYINVVTDYPNGIQEEAMPCPGNIGNSVLEFNDLN